MSTLLDKFGLSGDLFSTVADSPEVFESTGRTNTLHLDRRVAFTGSINGTEVPAYVTLRSAMLSRLSIIEQSSIYTGDSYKIVTGIFKPVKMDIELVIDGVTMTLQEVLRSFVNASAAQPIDEQMFLDTAARIGLKFTDGMPLFWQQFGASDEGIEKAFAAFAEAGAVNVLPAENANNIKRSYAHPTGVTVTSFELGTVDRSKSRTEQGFLNLVDASVDQFQRVVGLRKEASILKIEAAAQTDWAQKKSTEVAARIKLLGDMSRQWATNWAGAQQIIQFDEAGNKIIQDKYAAVNAPCGRFSMIVEGKIVEVDLWKNSARAESANAPLLMTDAPKADVASDEEPF